MTSQPLTNAEKNRKLPWALGGDAFNVVYVYLVMAGPVFLLFLDHLKLDKSQIGLVLALMPLAGLIAMFSGPISSRVGVKRVFLIGWVIRSFIMAGLIFAPWVVANHGLKMGFIYVVVIITLFALCRSVAESAIMLWQHEYIPANRRGKFSALQTVVIMVMGAIAVAAAGGFLGNDPPTLRFQILFAIGFVFGIGTVFCYAQLPGGQPLHVAPQDHPGLKAYLEPLRDKRFRRMLAAIALINISWSMMASFLPLFHRDYVKLREDQIVTLDAFMMAGQLCTCFLWGWTADRYGAKPQVVTTLCMLVVYPIALMLLPRDSAYSYLIAWGILFTLGLILPGWGIGFSRILYVDLIPPEKKMYYVPAYITINAAYIGISPLIAGYALDHMPTFQTSLGWFNIDPYTPFFLVCSVCLLLGAGIFATIPTGAKMPVTTFATMFVQGNPIAAMQAIIAHQFAGQENKRLLTIERLGQSNSPLNVEELISALFDPSFNVRHEAIISIARTRQNPRLTQAMLRVLTDGTPDLRASAAWALGRMGDPEAIPVLRQMLDSPYPLLRLRTARALGVLGDAASAPRIMTLFLEENDQGIAVAYIAALSALGQDNVVSQMLDFLQGAQESDIRQETAMAIAQLLSGDTQAMRLWRRMIAEPGDTLGGVMIGLRKRLLDPHLSAEQAQPVLDAIDQCTRHLAMEQFDHGIADLLPLLRKIHTESYTPMAQVILHEVAIGLEMFGSSRMEYLFLAIHALHVGQVDRSRSTPR